jgi:hypothetical protein
VAGETVRVNGLRETVRALDKVNRDAKKVVLAELASVAEPIAATARTKISRYQGASLSTITPRATTKGVFVRQNARKVSGRRSDFGALQMTHGLLPALADHADEIIPRLERALDQFGASQGF